MDIYRCRICSDPYLGSARPTQCPLCGARQRHLVPDTEYRSTPVGVLSKKSRENLNRVLELEVDNSTFYRGASKVADTEEGKALFTALARVEAEHASLISGLLEVDKPEELFETGECSPCHGENLAESRKRQARAVELYRRSIEEAKEERVREVLEAFIEIETDRQGLSG